MTLKAWILRGLAATALLATGLMGPQAASAQSTTTESALEGATCIGKMFNPISDTDWNNAFPITWGGTSPMNPPWMYEPPVCYCPSRIYPMIVVPGLGLTYWEPNVVLEIQREPGCLSSLGGVKVLPSYGALRANGNESRILGDNYNRMQVHNYRYPVFSMLSMFVSSNCTNPSGMEMSDMTEINPIWNMGGGWQAALTPWATLTSTPAAQAACAVEAAGLAAGAFPLPVLEWCNGSNGSASTMGGDLPQSNSSWSSNGLSAFKYLKFWAYIGGVWTTIGPMAQCFSYPFPILDKAQFRYQQIGPWPLMGLPIRLGDNTLRVGAVPTNFDIRDSTDVLLWQGMQCCLRF